MPHHPPHVLTRKESQLDVQTHATPDNTFLCVMYVINCMSAVIRRKEMLHGLHTVSIKAILTLGSVTLTFNRFFNLGFFGIRFFSPMHDMMRVRARARVFSPWGSAQQQAAHHFCPKLFGSRRVKRERRSRQNSICVWTQKPVVHVDKRNKSSESDMLPISVGKISFLSNRLLKWKVSAEKQCVSLSCRLDFIHARFSHPIPFSNPFSKNHLC